MRHLRIGLLVKRAVTAHRSTVSMNVSFMCRQGCSSIFTAQKSNKLFSNKLAIRFNFKAMPWPCVRMLLQLQHRWKPHVGFGASLLSLLN